MRKRILSLCLAMLITASAALPVLADEPVQAEAPSAAAEETAAAGETTAFDSDSETVSVPVVTESAQEEGENVLR